MKHLDVADLVELHYLGDESAAAAHVRACGLCAAGLERIREELRRDVSLHAERLHARPDTFWQRQRLAILRSLSGRRVEPRPTARYAAAAALVVMLSGALAYKTLIPGSDRSSPSEPATIATATATAAPAETSPTPVTVATTSASDPWESDALDEYHDLVNWESWEITDTKGRKES